MKVSQIADELDYNLVGSNDLLISGIAYASDAQESEIAVVKNKKDILSTRANIVLTEPCFIKTEKTMIFTYDGIGNAMKKVCEILIKHGIVKDYSKPVEYTNKNGSFFGRDYSIASGTLIGPGCFIGDDVSVGTNCVISAGTTIGSGTVIGNDVYIAPGSVVGGDSFFHINESKLIHFKGIGRVFLHDGVHVGSNTMIQRGTISDTIIGENTMIGNCVDIGHDVVIGSNCKIVSQTGIAGDAKIGNNVFLCGQTCISNSVVVGNNVTVKAKTLVSKSVPDNQTVFGLPGREANQQFRLMAKINKFFIGKE